MLTSGKIEKKTFASFAELAKEIHRADVQAAQIVRADAHKGGK